MQRWARFCEARIAMASRTSILMLIGAAALTAACSSTPPPETPPIEAPAPEPKEPVPPPPPPCEALSEDCAAEAETRARIAKSELRIRPVKGWKYAQGADATVAQSSEEGAAMAVAEVETGTDAKAEPGKRDEALEALAKQINVTLPKKKVTWKKPLEEKSVGEMKLGLWQLDGATRGEKKGPLLIFAGPTSEGKVILGIGFVPEDDSSGSDAAILESIESISAAEK